MRRLLTVIALTVAMGGNGAAAQVADVWSWSILVPSYTQTDILGTHLRDQVNRARLRDQPRPDLQPSDLQSSASADLRYVPSKERRRINLANFIGKTRAVDPNGAADLQQLFAEGDIIERIGTLIAPQGLRIDDLADAYALWWVTAWQATRGGNDTPDRASLAAVRAQAARALSGAGTVAGASDARKQELAEALLVQTALLDGAVEQAKRDPARMRQIGGAVRKGAQGMGLDMAMMELTRNGFVPGGGNRR